MRQTFQPVYFMDAFTGKMKTSIIYPADILPVVLANSAVLKSPQLIVGARPQMHIKPSALEGVK